VIRKSSGCELAADGIRIPQASVGSIWSVARTAVTRKSGRSIFRHTSSQAEWQQVLDSWRGGRDPEFAIRRPSRGYQLRSLIQLLILTVERTGFFIAAITLHG
jgi:hypothetical protein